MHRPLPQVRDPMASPTPHETNRERERDKELMRQLVSLRIVSLIQIEKRLRFGIKELSFDFLTNEIILGFFHFQRLRLILWDAKLIYFLSTFIYFDCWLFYGKLLDLVLVISIYLELFE